MYTLFILSTLDNYPDLVLWVYHEKPSMMIFYYIFTVFTSIVMLSVLTGVFYTNFKEHYSGNVSEQMKHPEARELIIECLSDDILNFEKVQKSIQSFVTKLREKNDKGSNNK